MITGMSGTAENADWLADQLDEATVALSHFKDQLDNRLGDAERDAVFALADPGHPCLEKLIVLLGGWADRLRKCPQQVGPGP